MTQPLPSDRDTDASQARQARDSDLLASLEHEREQIQADGKRLLFAVRECGLQGVPMPEWLAVEFARRMGRVLRLQAKTWDDVLGPLWPKGTQVETANRKMHRTWPAVSRAIRDLLLADPHLPINDQMWIAVGNAAGVSATTAEALYRQKVAAGLQTSIQELRKDLALTAAACELRRRTPGCPLDHGFLLALCELSGVEAADAGPWLSQMKAQGLEPSSGSELDPEKFRLRKFAKD